MFWNLWCERVRFFCPEDGGSSVSETSVATTTSASTLKVISTNKNLDENGKPQMWCKFGNDKGDHVSITRLKMYQLIFQMKDIKLPT